MTPEDKTMPERIWMCPSGNKTYSIEEAGTTPELQYIRADLCIPLSKLREICEWEKHELKPTRGLVDEAVANFNSQQNHLIRAINAALDAVLEKAKKEVG